MKSNWNKISNWYDSMVGDKGHDYHKKYAIPYVLKLLDLKKGNTILDIGCGQGVLAPYIKIEGCGYFGIDSSKNMISSAIKRHGKSGRFVVGSASEIETIKEINFMNFDSAVFMLSIQDMDPLDKIIKGVSKLIKKNGNLVIFMLHPSFRIPRQSGWIEDKNRKLLSRRVDRYMTEEVIPLDTRVKSGNKSVKSYFYHRPLSDYTKELTKNGWVIESLYEIKEEKEPYNEFPTFLALKCVKK